MNPSASSFERLIECPASAVLPQVRGTTDDAVRGTSLHAFIRRVRAGVPFDEALSYVAEEHQATCRALDWQKLGGDFKALEAETAFALDVESHEARVLGHNIGRAYPRLGPTWVVGSEDLGGLLEDGTPVTADIKTGQPVTPAHENAQVKFFARVRQLLTGAPRVVGRLLYVKESGQVFVDEHTFTAFELDCYGDELEDMVGRVRAAEEQYAAGQTPTVYPGEWCRYCASAPVCPANVALARSMASEQGLDELVQLAAKVALLTPEQAGIAYQRAKAAEAVLETVLKGVRALALQSPLPLPNGKILKPIQVERHDFSGKAALEMLLAKGTSEAEIATLYRANTIEQVRPCKAPKLIGAKTLTRKRKGEAA